MKCDFMWKFHDNINVYNLAGIYGNELVLFSSQDTYGSPKTKVELITRLDPQIRFSFENIILNYGKNLFSVQH